MPTPAEKTADPGVFVEASRQGDPQALAGLRQASDAALLRMLMARGASNTEAEDVLADFWADCVSREDDSPSLLEKFNGRCSFLGWAGTVVTRRWIDLKRKQQRHAELDQQQQGAEVALDPHGEARDDSLLSLLREVLQAAFAHCSTEALVLLRLLHEHGLTQRELGRMLGWNEAKVSRFLSATMAQIQNQTVRELKKRDPWLELTWDDLITVCQTYQVVFT